MGRPKGAPKTPGSGRKKGSVNKKTREIAAALKQLKVDGTDSMSFYVSILRNPDAPFVVREKAASELFPYTYPKLSSIEARTGGRTHEDRLEMLRKMLDDDPPPQGGA